MTNRFSQFGAVVAVSRSGSPRRSSLLYAANLTDIDIVIPDQPIWSEKEIEDFLRNPDLYAELTLPDSLPKKLLTLSFLQKSQFNHVMLFLPDSLTSLFFDRTSLFRASFLFFPKSLTHLTFPIGFNHNLELNPASCLTHLILGHDFGYCNRRNRDRVRQSKTWKELGDSGHGKG